MFHGECAGPGHPAGNTQQLAQGLRATGIVRDSCVDVRAPKTRRNQVESQDLQDLPLQAGASRSPGRRPLTSRRFPVSPHVLLQVEDAQRGFCESLSNADQPGIVAAHDSYPACAEARLPV